MKKLIIDYVDNYEEDKKKLEKYLIDNGWNFRYEEMCLK